MCFKYIYIYIYVFVVGIASVSMMAEYGMDDKSSIHHDV